MYSDTLFTRIVSAVYKLSYTPTISDDRHASLTQMFSVTAYSKKNTLLIEIEIIYCNSRYQ